MQVWSGRQNLGDEDSKFDFQWTMRQQTFNISSVYLAPFASSPWLAGMAFKYLPKTLELNFIPQFSFVELDSSSNRTHHQHKVLNAKFEVKVSHLFAFELNYGPTKGTSSI